MTMDTLIQLFNEIEDHKIQLEKKKREYEHATWLYKIANAKYSVGDYVEMKNYSARGIYRFGKVKEVRCVVRKKGEVPERTVVEIIYQIAACRKDGNTRGFMRVSSLFFEEEDDIQRKVDIEEIKHNG